MMKNVRNENKNAKLKFLNLKKNKNTHGEFDLVSNLPFKFKKLTSKVKFKKKH